MDLKNGELLEFAELWRQEFNEAISIDQARVELSRLIELLLLLSRPLPEEELLSSEGKLSPK